MALNKRYQPSEKEHHLLKTWQDGGIYHFQPESSRPVYSIDTPPATVSGNLHLGHVFSYSHADFIARFFRMNGYNVFYPMGFDDNGLPTDRLIEKRYGITASQIGRTAYIEKCLQISEEVEKEYRDLWQRIGLSVDWRYTYRTIDENSQRISQLSFLDLYQKGLVYRKEAPAIWCPECKISIAQADLNDLERQSELIDLVFRLESGEKLIIATTRPELIPACVAVFVHPTDERYRNLIGKTAQVPLFGQAVTILADPAADSQKGTGAVMCCTFGDTTDVSWWRNHNLPLVQAIDQAGKMTEAAGEYAGLPAQIARGKLIARLEAENLVAGHHPTKQAVRVHERCDSPVEYLVVPQWFIRVLPDKERFLAIGELINWVPEHMAVRYRTWVENLTWDWCISRQRYFGIPFPVWYCKKCGEVILANEEQLPVDPFIKCPTHPCHICGSHEYEPEIDTMDTWATSSMTPQIVGRWSNRTDQSLYEKVFPFSLRPQGHEIIRTWAFYTIVKSEFHFNKLPWKNILISGWGLAGEGMGKISKSRGSGAIHPREIIDRYSADAVRYWAASSSPGRDAVINEEKIQAGARLVTKLWNVACFSERFIDRQTPVLDISERSPADRWILSRLYRLIQRVTNHFEMCDYAAAKNEVEIFFWTEFTDNYLEMCKQRLYALEGSNYEAASGTLYYVLLSLVKLLAPLMPFITEEIYSELFASSDGAISVHRAHWPKPDPKWADSHAEIIGELLVEVATAVRRYKSDNNLSLGTELSGLKFWFSTDEFSNSEADSLNDDLRKATADLISITRAQKVEVLHRLKNDAINVNPNGRLGVSIDL